MSVKSNNVMSLVNRIVYNDVFFLLKQTCRLGREKEQIKLILSIHPVLINVCKHTMVKNRSWSRLCCLGNLKENERESKSFRVNKAKSSS